MDRARRPQRQEPALERERRRWRRRRLLLPSPPVSECSRPRRWRRPGPPLAAPPPRGGENGEVVSVAGRRRRRGPGPPARGLARLGPSVAPERGRKPRGLGLDPQHPAGPLSPPGRSAVILTLEVSSSPTLLSRPLPRTPSRAAGTEGSVRMWAQGRGTVCQGVLRTVVVCPGVPRSWPLGLSHCHLKPVFSTFCFDF